jgi:hypothetical protein
MLPMLNKTTNVHTDVSSCDVGTCKQTRVCAWHTHLGSPLSILHACNMLFVSM